MGAFSPILATGISPVISVTSSSISVTGVGITYQQFLASLGTFNYGTEFIYMSASNYQQITQAIQYFHFDSNGNQVQAYLPFVTDPYQFQPSIYYETEKDEIIFDGFSSLTFSLIAKSIVYIKFYVEIIYMAGALDGKNGSPFQKLEETEGVKFFDDYCNYIID
jgi:hypothetical protein